MDTGSQRKQFQCSKCARIYSRADHLSRHMRSHLREKPYKCDTCNRGFTRRDLLQRHLAAHRTTDGPGEATQAHVGRALRACEACAASKVKCDDTRPCGRCRLRQLVCEPVEEASGTDELLAHDIQLEQCPAENNSTSRTFLSLEPTIGTQSILDFSCNVQTPSFGEFPEDLMLCLSRLDSFDEVGLAGSNSNVPRTNTLNLDSRQRVISFLCSISQPIQANQIRRAFPPTEVLNGLVQTFFYHQRNSECPFVHGCMPNCNEESPMLLAAIITCGATASSAEPLQVFGLAMQNLVASETTRLLLELSIPDQDLKLLQSHLCILELAFWSGSKRKRDAADSMGRALFGAMRNAGTFRRSYDTTLEVEPCDTGPALHGKWLMWIRKESLRRLAYRAFIFDGQASFSLLANPSIRYSEMCTSLPSSPHLWEAPTMEEWKSRKLAHSGGIFVPPLAMADLLRQPTNLINFQTIHDVRFSILAILYSAWAMVLETLHLLAQTNIRPDYSHISLAVRHQDLRQLLSHISEIIAALELSPCPALMVMLNLVKMHLHIRIEEVQQFAASGSPAETCRVFPLLQQWVLDPTSRQALWSAGQVLRAARDFQPQTLRDFYAFAVYHTGVCFWAYAVILKTVPLPDITDITCGLSSGIADPPVVLNEIRTDITEAFLDYDQGQAVVNTPLDADSSNYLSVSILNVPGTMAAVSDVLWRNHISLDGNASLSPLVQNIMNLLGSLSDQIAS